MNKTLYLYGLSAICSMPLAAKEKASQRPNFVIALADDLGYGDISCFGSQTISTPNLDALAEKGIKFDNFYANGSVCTPTRASLLTGRYQNRAGLPGVILLEGEKNENAGLRSNEITFAEVLGRNGYKTALYGKWHLGSKPEYSPVSQGFQEFRGFKSGNVDYYSHLTENMTLDWWNGNKTEDEKGYSTDLITSHTNEFITKNRNNPFCVYVAYNTVHVPLVGPGDQAWRTPGEPKPPFTPKDKNEKARRYKAMIESMDKNIGTILTTLKENNLEKNTFFIFMSDNGPSLKVWGSAGPFRDGKGSLYEGGIRVPCIMYMPGAAGSINHQPIMTMDVFPSLIEMAQIKYKSKAKPLDGVSFLPVLKGKAVKERTLYWERSKDMQAVREGDWKLLRLKNGLSLYNLAKDPKEQNNLADSHPDIVKNLTAKLTNWSKEVNSEVPNQLE